MPILLAWQEVWAESLNERDGLALARLNESFKIRLVEFDTVFG
jgi:hypothetical protein